MAIVHKKDGIPDYEEIRDRVEKEKELNEYFSKYAEYIAYIDPGHGVSSHGKHAPTFLTGTSGASWLRSMIDEEILKESIELDTDSKQLFWNKCLIN